MIPYMNLNEQVDADFTRARRRARLRAVVARIRRRSCVEQVALLRRHKK